VFNCHTNISQLLYQVLIATVKLSPSDLNFFIVQLNEQIRFSVIRVPHFVQVHCYTLHVLAFEISYNLRVKDVFTLKYLLASIVKS
jgi:hypothetical protein